MARAQPRTNTPPTLASRPRWSVLLRSLREVAGVSQVGWVTLLQLAAQEHGRAIAASEDTLQRWEAGRSVPDAAAETAIIAVCRERGLLRPYTTGSLAGLTVTAELLQAMLAEARLGSGRAPVLQALPPRPHSNLPAPVSSFIGRERELAALAQLLADERLVTLTGAGGVGKTRLALELARMVAEQYPEGVWLVELASLQEPALVPRAVAATLGISETAGSTPVHLLLDRLGTARALLVLDNCEHLPGTPAEIAEALLHGCPSLRVLATSRHPLAVAGEHVWRVPTMAVPNGGTDTSRNRDQPLGAPALDVPPEQPDAVRLFVARARAARADAAIPAESIAAISAICRRLDGIPLALELAAARTRVLSVEQIAARLDQDHRLIGGAASGRHQTLTAAIDWSHDLLTADERTLFRRLAVFAGGFTLEAAEAVCVAPARPSTAAGQSSTGDADVFMSLAGLVEKSLVVVEPGPDGEAWYRLLEPLRQYAAARLAETEERAWLAANHAAWYLTLVEQRGGPGVKGPEQAYWLARLDFEHDNVRAALRYVVGDRAGESGLRLATAMAEYWIARGYFAEGSGWVEAALAAPDGRDAAPRLRAAALNQAGILAARRGDYTRARAWLEECLDLARASEDRLFTARALNHLGITAREQGDLAGAREAYQAGLELFEQLGDRRGIGVVHNNLGNVAREQGMLDAAVVHYEMMLTIGHERGDEDAIAMSLHHLGSIALDRDHLASARTLLEDSLTRRRRLGRIHGIAGVLATLGTLSAVEGKFPAARSLFEESLALARRDGHDRDTAHTLRSYGHAALEHGDSRAEALFEEGRAIAERLGDRVTLLETLAGLSSVALAAGDPAAGAALARESLRLAREIGFRKGIAIALRALAAAETASGRKDAAALYYREALRETRKLESTRGVAACFEGLAALVADSDPLWAAGLLGTAAAQRERAGTPAPARGRADQEALKEALRAALGADGLARAEADGRATPLQTAIEQALAGATSLTA